LTYPDGKQVSYTYDALNRLTTLTDWASRTITYSYDAVSNPITLTYPNSTSSAYAYDAVNRLLVITHTSTVSGTLATFHYTLDALGHRTQVVDADGTSTYAYDPLSRLRQVVYPNGEAVTYAYNTVGNRTAMTSTVSGVITYTYDAGDRLLTASGTVATWDANGNMLTKGSTAYTYDAANRLTQVVSGTTTVQFTYDGDGNRASKAVNGTTTSYLYDVNLPLPQLLVETPGGQSTLYLYGAGLIACIAPDSTPTYYHYDGLGSVRLLSNASGQSVATYAYDAFGALRSATGNATNPFRFTGEQTDGETSLVYLRTRYYDPTLGRFITRDWFAGFAESPQSHNRYIYCQNNPVNLTDPSGEVAIVPFLAMYAGNITKSVVCSEARVLATDIVHSYQHFERTGEIAFKSSGKQAYLDAAKEGLKSGLMLGWIPGPLGQGIRGIRDLYKWGELYFSMATPVGEEDSRNPSLRPYSGFGVLLERDKAARPIQPPSQSK
jgi:RHS repeat-associated protein